MSLGVVEPSPTVASTSQDSTGGQRSREGTTGSDESLNGTEEDSSVTIMTGRAAGSPPIATARAPAMEP